jgi:hypothetical protein
VANPSAVIDSNEEWANELTRLLDWNAHLNDHFTADAALVQRIKSEGVLVFSRNGNDLDFQFEDELEDFDPDAD